MIVSWDAVFDEYTPWDWSKEKHDGAELSFGSDFVIDSTVDVRAEEPVHDNPEPHSIRNLTPPAPDTPPPSPPSVLQPEFVSPPPNDDAYLDDDDDITPRYRRRRQHYG